MRPAAAIAACLLASTAVAAPAQATVTPAQTIDGPSADVVGFDGAAMAGDGTGGIVYRKRVDGRVHVFAAQYAGGAWRRPQRIDAGQRFDSSWPAIGAGDGGRLVVVWVQENGVEYDRLYSATLGPGASRFGAPVPVDMNVGEAFNTWPSVAMNAGGQAFVAYRTQEDPAKTPNLPRGYVAGEIRVARYTGELWSTLGYPVNRNAASPVATPTRENAPRIAIDPSGAAVVAWQEPDDEFVDRVWARRVFPSGQIGVPLLVSPTTTGDQPLRAPADQFDLDVAGFGQAVVALRQRGTRGAPARIWTALMPESFTDKAAAFEAAKVADGLGQSPAAPPGPVSVATVAGATMSAFSVADQSLLTTDDARTIAVQRLDAGGSTQQGDPQVDLAPSGAVALAWRLRVGSRGQVALEERRADGVPETRTVTADRGGPVGTMDLAGSGLGDAIVGWQQGADAGAQIAAAVIDAPPGDFAVQTPVDFTNDRGTYRLRWDPAPNGVGAVRYSVLLDDAEAADGLTRLTHTVNLAKLEDGVTSVRIVARDGRGQETTSVPAAFKLDRRAPRVELQRREGRRLRVVLRDGARNEVSGVDHASAEIRWGDGRTAAGREGASAITHHYRRAGRFTVTVAVTDRAGNRRTVRRRVVVR